MFIFRKRSQGHLVLGLTASFLSTVFPAAGSGVLTAQRPPHASRGWPSPLCLWGGCSRRAAFVKKVLTAWLFTLDAAAPRAGCFALCFFVVETKWGDKSPFWFFFARVWFAESVGTKPWREPRLGQMDDFSPEMMPVKGASPGVGWLGIPPCPYSSTPCLLGSR